jgi:hypothetical protein
MLNRANIKGSSDPVMGVERAAGLGLRYQLIGSVWRHQDGFTFRLFSHLTNAKLGGFLSKL